MDKTIVVGATRQETVGLDLGDRESSYCVVDGFARVIEEGRIASTAAGLENLLSKRKPTLVAIEAGAQSAWVSRAIVTLGHEVLIANPRKLRLIYKNPRKSDRVDAEYLARLARLDPKLLGPIQHRGPKAQADLALLRSREALVAARTQLVNHARGVVKSVGGRLPSCSTPTFGKRTWEHVPEELRFALTPIFEQIASLTREIQKFDRAVEDMARTQYPETAHLQTVPGVGWLTALAFVLTIENPARFPRSRSIAAYLGLVPRQSDSGDSEPQLNITKAGDVTLRKLLVGAAQYALGPFGPDSDLRRWGLTLAARGGKNAKRRAVVAVARKLAVLLLRLWVTGQDFRPFRSAPQPEPNAVAAGSPPAETPAEPPAPRRRRRRASQESVENQAEVARASERGAPGEGTSSPPQTPPLRHHPIPHRAAAISGEPSKVSIPLEDGAATVAEKATRQDSSTATISTSDDSHIHPKSTPEQTCGGEECRSAQSPVPDCARTRKRSATPR